MEHLQDNLGAAEIAIADADWPRLDVVAEPEQAIVPYYSGKMIDSRPRGIAGRSGVCLCA